MASIGGLFFQFRFLQLLMFDFLVIDLKLHTTWVYNHLRLKTQKNTRQVLRHRKKRHSDSLRTERGPRLNPRGPFQYHRGEQTLRQIHGSFVVSHWTVKYVNFHLSDGPTLSHAGDTPLLFLVISLCGPTCRRKT